MPHVPEDKKIDRKAFFDKIKPLFKAFTQTQVEGIDAILDEWEKRELTDLRWLAYILATAFHETAKTMQPLREYGRGKGKKYGVVNPITKQVYYGRGHVQLTHPENYIKFSNLLKVDLYLNPDLALRMDISVQILFEGMIRGMFTGLGLSHFFNEKDEQWVNARRVVNGTDRAGLIAGYAHAFYDALKQSQ